MSRTCSECGVRDRALCASLDDAQLAALGALGVQRQLVRGETLIRAGDPPLVCANLQTGVMKLSTVTASGEEAITGLLFPGDFIGRPFMGSAEHDIVALTDVELCVFPRAAFERALHDHRRMEQLLLERTLAELDRARRSLVTLGRASAGARVAGFLDDIARRMAVSGCQAQSGPAGRSFDLPLSRGEIADVLGLTIETVSRQMTRLRTAGIIDLPGGRAIVVCNAAGLAAEAAA
jgi:CRP/FNR family transcriptional regulator, anaerobic regulatory protein